MAFTIGNNVTQIGSQVFWSCQGLRSVYFEGNAPSAGYSLFGRSSPLPDYLATAYYLPRTTGWGPWFSDAPTALWFLPKPLILNNPSFGVKTNQFGFIISWATNIPVVVESCGDLVKPTWFPISTNYLTNGSVYFSDPQWTNHPARFYRICAP
jgi:hypothetical protein